MTATEWRDGYGRTWWQPTLPDGKVACWVSDYEGDRHRTWSVPTSDTSFTTPVLYRSNARANRVAAREYKRRQAHDLRQVRQVKGTKK